MIIIIRQVKEEPKNRKLKKFLSLSALMKKSNAAN